MYPLGFFSTAGYRNPTTNWCKEKNKTGMEKRISWISWLRSPSGEQTRNVAGSWAKKKSSFIVICSTWQDGSRIKGTCFSSSWNESRANPDPVTLVQGLWGSERFGQVTSHPQTPPQPDGQRGRLDSQTKPGIVTGGGLNGCQSAKNKRLSHTFLVFEYFSETLRLGRLRCSLCFLLMWCETPRIQALFSKVESQRPVSTARLVVLKSRVPDRECVRMVS